LTELEERLRVPLRNYLRSNARLYGNGAPKTAITRQKFPLFFRKSRKRCNFAFVMHVCTKHTFNHGSQRNRQYAVQAPAEVSDGEYYGNSAIGQAPFVFAQNHAAHGKKKRLPLTGNLSLDISPFRLAYSLK
jgi:hypothetical protein